MQEWIYSGTALREGQVVNNLWVSVENGKIISLENHEQDWKPTQGQITAYFPDDFLLPGLIDTHVHLVHDGIPAADWECDPVLARAGDLTLRALKNAQKQLQHGITTVRDCGSRDLADICVRDAIDSGQFTGCRIISCGHAITSTAGHMDPRRYIRPGIPYESTAYMGIPADSVGEARQAVRRCIMEGSDCIKINVSITEPVRHLNGNQAPEMTLDVMKEIISIAHQNLRRVTGHSHGGVAVDHAIEAGIDSLEHGRFLSDFQLEKMAEKGIFLTPTLSPDKRPPQKARKRKPSDEAWMERSRARMYGVVQIADRIGVKITAGSDAGMAYVPHGDISYEICYLAEAGLSNVKAIQAGTEYAADNLGISNLTGSIKEGLSADIIVVPQNPVQNPEVLKEWEKFQLIMKDGVAIQNKNLEAAASS